MTKPSIKIRQQINKVANVLHASAHSQFMHTQLRACCCLHWHVSQCATAAAIEQCYYLALELAVCASTMHSTVTVQQVELHKAA
jgi:hypothetical protein